MSQLLDSTDLAEAQTEILGPPPSAAKALDPEAPSRPCQPDLRDRRRLGEEEARRDLFATPTRRADSAQVALELSGLGTLAERIDFYKRHSSAALVGAAAYYPELMSRLNDEFEWHVLLAP
jgi:hypothetical protein